MRLRELQQNEPEEANSSNAQLTAQAEAPFCVSLRKRNYSRRAARPRPQSGPDALGTNGARRRPGRNERGERPGTLPDPIIEVRQTSNLALAPHSGRSRKASLDAFRIRELCDVCVCVYC